MTYKLIERLDLQILAKDMSDDIQDKLLLKIHKTLCVANLNVISKCHMRHILLGTITQRVNHSKVMDFLHKISSSITKLRLLQFKT